MGFDGGKVGIQATDKDGNPVGSRCIYFWVDVNVVSTSTSDGNLSKKPTVILRDEVIMRQELQEDDSRDE